MPDQRAAGHTLACVCGGGGVQAGGPSFSNESFYERVRRADPGDGLDWTDSESPSDWDSSGPLPADPDEIRARVGESAPFYAVPARPQAGTLPSARSRPCFSHVPGLRHIPSSEVMFRVLRACP